MYDDIALFITIARLKSLSAAAEQMKLSSATVTRRLRKLEEDLGCKLIHRSAQKFILTPEGESYYHNYADLIRQFDEAASTLGQEIHALKGRLTVLAPTNISVGILQPMWSAFVRKYPEITLDLQLTNSVADLLRTRADIALRVGPQADSLFTQKKLGQTRSILVASKNYLQKAGSPRNPKELEQHRVIAVKYFPDWQLDRTQSSQQEVLRPSAQVLVDDIGLAAQLASDGHGIALLPASELLTLLEREKLEHILPQWCGPVREIHAVWPSERLLSARAKCLRDFMQDYIAAIPVLQGALPGHTV
ncbi:LysR family transcriptional regulator [Kiloniella sp. b19]|uniref:LysR family transcriptional regulator n=1 Tax=Kiloniella sp. GXU_MW_B19 TaxID=3141326 RepID=UPI0031D0BD52